MAARSGRARAIESLARAAHAAEQEAGSREVREPSSVALGGHRATIPMPGQAPLFHRQIRTPVWRPGLAGMHSRVCARRAAGAAMLSIGGGAPKSSGFSGNGVIASHGSAVLGDPTTEIGYKQVRGWKGRSETEGGKPSTSRHLERLRQRQRESMATAGTESPGSSEGVDDPQSRAQAGSRVL